MYLFIKLFIIYCPIPSFDFSLIPLKAISIY